MAALPFRPPQFSDDSAWLPSWIQSNQVATPLFESNDDRSHGSPQNTNSCKGDNNPVKGSNILSGENCNPYRLHLSGQESQVVFTPSCEKLLHFNLHLSTDGFSSIIIPSPLEISEYEKVTDENTKQVEPGEAPIGTEEARKSNVYRNVSIVDNFPSSNGKESCDVPDKTKSDNNNYGEEILKILKSNGTEGDGISDAVELSVAASEALAIYDIVQSESISEALSAAAVLEIALRVKHARLEGSQDSLCCIDKDDNAIDILSELCDSDMEEAYADVGFSLNSLNTVPKDSSVSRVMDTPLEFQPEVQSDVHIDRETFVNYNFAEKPLENNLGTSKLMNLPTENIDSRKLEYLCRNTGLDVTVGTHQSQLRSSDDFQIIQGDYKRSANVDGLSQQIEEKSFSQVAMSAKANEIEMGQLNNNSSSRFQSRWFGGWTGQDGYTCATKTILGPFNGETSYLSESADVAPDQSSFVHNNPHYSKLSDSIVPLEDSCGTANAAAMTEQDAVKDSILSPTDPLCSVVPCSLSISSSFRVPDAVKGKMPELDNLLVDAQITTGVNDENIRSQEHNQQSLNSIGPNPIYRRTLTSLRPYSMGLPPENPTSSFNNFNCGWLRPEECNARLLSGNHENGVVSPTPIISTSHRTAIRSNGERPEVEMLSMSHVKSGNTSNGKLDRIVPALSSKFRSYIVRNDEESREIIGQRNAFDISFQDGANRNVENGAELHVQLQEPAPPPMVLCRTRRRFKAPKSPLIHTTTVNQVHDQAPESDMILNKNREDPQSQQGTFPNSDVSDRKRVRFSEIAINPKKSLNRLPHNRGIRSSSRVRKKPKHFDEFQVSASQEVKERLTKCPTKSRKRTVFRGLEFLLTGFSKKKEKELEGLLCKHGALVLSDIPTPPAYPRGKKCSGSVSQRLPVILCTKKLQTTKFLYGCAVNAFLLKVGWAYDSIKAGSVLPPDKYVILSNRPNQKMNHIGKSTQNNDDYIFDKVGIMLHGRHSFCSKLNKFIKHGGGHVYKSLQWLVQSLESNKISAGAIVAEDENHATRHLKKCASEQKIPVLPGSWIINSLHEGKLLPFKDSYQISRLLKTPVPKVLVDQNWSQEI